MAQDIQAGTRSDSRGHALRIVWVADAEGRLEVPVRDASLGFLLDKIKNRSAGGLGPRTSRGRNSNKGTQLPVNRSTLPQGGVDKVKEVGVRVTEVQVHQLGGVDDRAATNGKEGVRVVRAHPVDCGLDGIVFGFDVNFVKDDIGDALTVEALPLNLVSANHPSRGLTHDVHIRKLTTTLIASNPSTVSSVTTQTFFAPRFFKSIPTSCVTPGPKRIDEAAISKAYSF